MSDTTINLAVIGLGYVGLPLAVAFGSKRSVTGFDINPYRIAQLQDGKDVSGEVHVEDLARASGLRFTSHQEDLGTCNCFIIAVPTPIDHHKKPDLSALVGASQMVAKNLKKGDLVIYESTVYPGCTEEDCVPVLERHSGLRFNVDFHCGYSPERINPGDRERPISSIVKVTSGSTPEVADRVDALYREIIDAGTHKAASIRIAEAAKVIENAQRDLNIAFINEVSMILSRMRIDTESVLQAAGTKWNFMRLQPGLVGGHCIGVDPYYLIHKAQALGYRPDLMLAGRRTNEFMATHVVHQLATALDARGISLPSSRVLVMGMTFKENCADHRNTRVVDIVDGLRQMGSAVEVFDPWFALSDGDEPHRSTLALVDAPQEEAYDAIILAVAHRQFKAMGADGIRKLGKRHALVYDLKFILPADQSDLRL